MAAMISFDEAVGHIADVALPLGTEHVPLAAAHGRVLAVPVLARISSPACDVSTMDGYAARDADLATIPARLHVSGEAFAGRGHAQAVPSGGTVRIFTGAAVPQGADRVIIQEDVRRDGDWAVIEALGGTRNIRAAGSDFRAGDLLLDAGVVLSPRSLVVAAAADCAEVEVCRRPRLRLLATGDELVEPGTAHGRPDAIPDSVSFGVAALADDWGAETVERLRLADDLPALQQAAAWALDGADILVVTGGASVGERDFARAMFGDGLRLVFSKVAMKPGKPVWLGQVGDTLILGLPGNPTSAMVTTRLLLAPLLTGMSGRGIGQALAWRRATLAEAIGPAGDRETFARARWTGERVTLLPNQDSGAQKMLATAELLVRRPAGTLGFEAEAWVDVLDF
jgi:molybdopterin molybdotransferase